MGYAICQGFTAPHGSTPKWSLITKGVLSPTIKNMSNGFFQVGSSSYWGWEQDALIDGLRGLIVIHTNTATSNADFTGSNVLGALYLNPGEIELVEKSNLHGKVYVVRNLAEFTTALAAAISGDEIRMVAGDYSGSSFDSNRLSSSGVTIRGAGVRATRIIGFGVGLGCLDRTTIIDVGFYNCTYAISVAAAGGASRVSVQRCYGHSCVDFAYPIDQPMEAIFSDCATEECMAMFDLGQSTTSKFTAIRCQGRLISAFLAWGKGTFLAIDCDADMLGDSGGPGGVFSFEGDITILRGSYKNRNSSVKTFYNQGGTFTVIGANFKPGDHAGSGASTVIIHDAGILVGADGHVTADLDPGNSLPSTAIAGTYGGLFKNLDSRLPITGTLATLADLPTELTQQQIRDSMKLPASAGAPTAGSIDQYTRDTYLKVSSFGTTSPAVITSPVAAGGKIFLVQGFDWTATEGASIIIQEPTLNAWPSTINSATGHKIYAIRDNGPGEFYGDGAFLTPLVDGRRQLQYEVPRERLVGVLIGTYTYLMSAVFGNGRRTAFARGKLDLSEGPLS